MRTYRLRLHPVHPSFQLKIACVCTLEVKKRPDAESCRTEMVWPNSVNVHMTYNVHFQ